MEESKFFLVQHNIHDPAFFMRNVKPIIDNMNGLSTINVALHDIGLHQVSLNFPKTNLPTVGWCVFEANNDWDITVIFRNTSL